MSRKSTILAVSIAAAFLGGASAAFGASELSAGLERFEWTETAPGGARILKESGPLFVLGGRWEQDKDQGLVLGLRSHAFFGSVDYDGQTWGGAPVATDVNYLGAGFEGRAIWRIPSGGWRADLFGALGYRLWVRDIESTYSAVGYAEGWRAPYAGIGIALSEPGEKGFYGEALVGKPFSVRNKAFLTDAGFDGDVTLKPEGKLFVSLEAGYRFSSLAIAGYYRQVRFGESGAETASLGGMPVLVFQPESEEKTLGARLSYRF